MDLRWDNDILASTPPDSDMGDEDPPIDNGNIDANDGPSGGVGDRDVETSSVRDTVVTTVPSSVSTSAVFSTSTPICSFPGFPGMPFPQGGTAAPVNMTTPMMTIMCMVPGPNDQMTYQPMMIPGACYSSNIFCMGKI